MSQGAVLRRLKVNIAERKGEQAMIKKITPALTSRFKSLSRELRRSNLRKRLAKNDGLLYKANETSGWDDWNLIFVNNLYDSLDDGLGYIWDAEQRYWISHDYPVFPYKSAEVLAQYQSTDRDATRIKNIPVDTEKQVNEIIAEWYKTDQGLPELIGILERLFGAARAELIATTEMAYVASFVARNQMKEYGITHWIWDAFKDGVTCDICLDLMARSRSTPFTLDDPMPPDPSHPRCRCGVYYVGVDIK